jgi:guanine nucleotide-binding protein subunit alpha
MSPSPADDDPLTLALMPPPDETLEERQVREAAEAEAKRVSDEIDEQIKRERENERRRKRPVKLLLLGEFPVSLHCCALLI